VPPSWLPGHLLHKNFLGNFRQFYFLCFLCEKQHHFQPYYSKFGEIPEKSSIKVTWKVDTFRMRKPATTITAMLVGEIGEESPAISIELKVGES
jgi:hypothetical protein